MSIIFAYLLTANEPKYSLSNHFSWGIGMEPLHDKEVRNMVVFICLVHCFNVCECKEYSSLIDEFFSLCID